MNTHFAFADTVIPLCNKTGSDRVLHACILSFYSVISTEPFKF